MTKGVFNSRAGSGYDDEIVGRYHFPPRYRQAAEALVRAPPNVQARQVVQLLVNRTVRDASFRRQVCDAYDDPCAVTGLCIVNGGGRAEAQAAHIWPAAARTWCRTASRCRQQCTGYSTAT